MHKMTLGLALAAAVCAATPALADAAPMDSSYANCDGSRTCQTGDLTVGGGTVYADFDLQGLNGTTATISVVKNGVAMRYCTWTVLVGSSGTRSCDVGNGGDVYVKALSQAVATTFRLGWHQ